MKKFAIGAAVVIGLMVVILAVLPFAIDLNKHKGAILTQIKTHTNRQVDFQSIRLTILTGLGAEIKGLHISDDPAFSSEDFISLNSAKVKVAILPLLSRQIKIKTVVLKEPSIHVVKNSLGVFNFTTLLIPKPGEEAKKKTPKPGAFASLLVSNVVIKHGLITYRDDTLKPGAKPFTISNIDLESQDISMLRPVSFSLSASVMNPDGQNFALAGTVGPVPREGGLGQTPIDVHLLLDALPLNTLPVNMPFQAGTMKIDITAKGILKDKISSKAVMDLDGLVLNSQAGKQQVKDRKGISCRISSDMALEIDRQQLMIANGTFEIGQDRGNFEGSVQNLKTNPTWNISLKSSRITPGPILAQLPMFAGLIPDKIILTGPAGFSVTTTGNKEAFQVNTAIDMRPMAITFGKIFHKPVNSPMSFSTRMTMKKDITEINALDIDLGAITATGTGEVRKVQDKSSYQIRIQTNPAPLETAQAIIPMLQDFKPTGNMVLKTAINGGAGAMTVNMSALSDHMGLVLTKPTAEDQAKGKLLAGPVTASLNGVTLSVDAQKKDKGMGMNGIIKSRQGTIKELPFTNLTSTFTYGDDRFKVNSFDLAVLKGSIKGAVSYNLKTKAWEASPTFNNVQAGNVLDAMTSFKGVFAGTLTGDVKAQGVAGAPALNNLGALVNLRINKGEWKNFDLAGKVLGTLVGVPGLSEAFGLAPSEVQKYQTTRFETMNAQVDLAHKVINVNSMQLLNITSGKDVDTESNLKGTISMETNEVHLKGNVILPKRFSQRMGARAEAFSSIMNEQKRLVLPMTITGSLKKPIPMVDAKSLSNAMTRYFATKVLDKGLKKLQDKVGLPQDTGDTKKNIKNTLEDLFKKK